LKVFDLSETLKKKGKRKAVYTNPTVRSKPCLEKRGGDAVSSASRAHKEIEKLYAPFVDFAQIAELTDRLTVKILRNDKLWRKTGKETICLKPKNSLLTFFN